MTDGFEDLKNVEARRSFLGIIAADDGGTDWRTTLARDCNISLADADRLALIAIARELVATSARLMEFEETQQVVNRLTGGIAGGLLGFSETEAADDENTPDDDVAEFMALARRTASRIREGAGLTS